MSENQGPNAGGFPPPGGGHYPPPPGSNPPQHGGYPPPPGNFPPPPGNFPPPPGGFPPPPPPPPMHEQPYQPGGTYPVDVSFDYPQRSNRLLAGLSIPFFLARSILLIPVGIALYFVGIGAFIVAWIALWPVVFTGRYPRGMYDFVAGYVRWSTRATAYGLGLVDKYPPWRLGA